MARDCSGPAVSLEADSPYLWLGLDRPSTLGCRSHARFPAFRGPRGTSYLIPANLSPNPSAERVNQAGGFVGRPARPTARRYVRKRQSGSLTVFRFFSQSCRLVSFQSPGRGQAGRYDRLRPGSLVPRMGISNAAVVPPRGGPAGVGAIIPWEQNPGVARAAGARPGARSGMSSSMGYGVIPGMTQPGAMRRTRAGSSSRMARSTGQFREFARRGSRGQAQGHRRAAKDVAEEVQDRTPLLPARPPHRHQHRLRPRTGPRPAAPDLSQDDAEADG
jgi:hypothetical protein